jgi:hypothetical protein
VKWLSENLKSLRDKKPDEWTMDGFIKSAENLKKEILEVNEIKKQALNESINLLRDALNDENGLGRTHRRGLICQAIGQIKAILEYYEESLR